MSIYVDPLLPCTMTAKWHHNQACHLIGDDLDELHKFARKLGLKRSWFQADAALPHYDLTASKRRLAVTMGAIEIGLTEMGRRIHKGRLREFSVRLHCPYCGGTTIVGVTNLSRRPIVSQCRHCNRPAVE